MLLWNEQFATGEKTIDEQHRVLFETINRLEGFLDRSNLNRADTEFILSLVSYLEGYVRDHFEREEHCMERHRCPAHRLNLDAHRQFMVVLETYHAQFQFHGPRLENLRSLHEFMHRWIQQHIMRIDVQLKPCLTRLDLA